MANFDDHPVSSFHAEAFLLKKIHTLTCSGSWTPRRLAINICFLLSQSIAAFTPLSLQLTGRRRHFLRVLGRGRGGSARAARWQLQRVPLQFSDPQVGRGEHAHALHPRGEMKRDMLSGDLGMCYSAKKLKECG